VREIFIDGTQLTQVDYTKVGMQIEKETGTRWQDGCIGTPVTKGFLDLSKVESAFQPGRSRTSADRPSQAGAGVGAASTVRRPRVSTTWAASIPTADRGAPFPPKAMCIIAAPRRCHPRNRAGNRHQIRQRRGGPPKPTP
jgi:hypothetical protein